MAPFIATRVYLKPLLSGSRKSVDVTRVLKSVKRSLLRRIRTKLAQTDFSDEAKAALAKAITVEVKQSSLQVSSTHPAFGPLVKGQRKGQMKWLVKAKRPIPIFLKNGKLIFRNATPRSMQRRHWIHPGRSPSDFIDKAKAEARAMVKKRLAEEVRKQIHSMFGGKRR